MTNLYKFIQRCKETQILVSSSENIPNFDLNEIATSNKSQEKAKGFIALTGANFDSHQLIDEMIEKGAKVIIHSHEVILPDPIKSIRVSNGYLAHAILCELRENTPTDQLQLLAVTGTNGKTTSAFILQKLVANLLNNAKCGLLSTVLTDDGESVIPAEQTTPAPAQIQRLFAQMGGNKCTHAVMEQSSHGLHQYRTGTAQFCVGIFTNLTGDHLDYHKTTTHYYEAKKRLFTECLDKNGTAIINIDDSYGEKLWNELQSKNIKCISFGQNSCADVRILAPHYSLQHTTFQLQIGTESFDVTSPYIGEYNIYNLTGALIAIHSLGIDYSTLFEKLKDIQLPQIPGRMEAFILPNQAVAFVDYAHTDDALERAIKALREINPQRIITVFGCGGNRDKSKRPRMGKVASENSDITIITSDNPRDEVPLDIIHDIKCGITVSYGGNIHIEQERARAIEMALNMAHPNDAILIAGKGHEDYQEIRGIKHHFDDREMVKVLIQKS